MTAVWRKIISIFVLVCVTHGGRAAAYNLGVSVGIASGSIEQKPADPTRRIDPPVVYSGMSQRISYLWDIAPKLSLQPLFENLVLLGATTNNSTIRTCYGVEAQYHFVGAARSVSVGETTIKIEQQSESRVSVVVNGRQENYKITTADKSLDFSGTIVHIAGGVAAATGFGERNSVEVALMHTLSTLTPAADSISVVETYIGIGLRRYF